MRFHSIMRYTYSLGWSFGILAVIARAFERLFPDLLKLPVTARGMLFFGGFLFLCTIATGIYMQVMKDQKPMLEIKGKSAA